MALTSTQSIRNKIDVLKKMVPRMEDCANTFDYVLNQNDVTTWGLTEKGAQAVTDMKHQVGFIRNNAIVAINKAIAYTEAYCDRVDSING